MDLTGVRSVLRPGSLEEWTWREGDAAVAGGTWLFSEPQPGTRRLIDLQALRWPALRAMPDGLHIAATCSFAELAAWEAPAAWGAAALIGPCCDALVGSFKVQAVATIGGNLCLALPAAPMLALAVALDGMCELVSARGVRWVAAGDFAIGPQQTVRMAGEVLRTLWLPEVALRRRVAFRRAALSVQGRSAALLIGTLDEAGFALTVTAATRRPVRLGFGSLPDRVALAEALEAAIPEALLFDDVHGRPEWRRHMTSLLAEEIRCAFAPC